MSDHDVPGASAPHGPEVERARALLGDAQTVAVLTGAGISTDSGIPDFRGPKGVWTTDPDAEKKSHIDYYVAHPDHREARWARMADGSLWPKREPNDGHRALLALEERSVLHTLVTQNVDGLHEAAGTSPDKIVEIHGTTQRVKCLDCGDGAPMEKALDRVRAGEADPPCKSCGGILKSATVSFGQSLPVDGLRRAEVAARECDVLLCIGTTLAVYPIANMVPIAVNEGADVVILNGEATQFDHIASAVIHGSISEVLPHLLG